MFKPRQKKINHSRSGMALVMALVLLSVMMTSALSLGRFILNELQMSVNSTNAISAFYAADSGLEKGLYYLKYGIDKWDLAIFDGLDQTANNPRSINNSNGASYSFLSAKTTSPQPSAGQHTYTVYDISTSSPGTLPGNVNIMDPSGNVQNIDWGPGNVIGTTYTYTYKVSWKVKNCFPTHASDRLEVANVSFTNNFTDVRNESNILVCDCAYAFFNDSWCSAAVSQFNMEDTRYYNFSFRPLDGKVEELGFDVFENVSGLPAKAIGIKSEAFIDVVGNYHNSTYRLQAKLPSLNVISGVFSYVIFSEQPIIKNP